MALTTGKHCPFITEVWAMESEIQASKGCVWKISQRLKSKTRTDGIESIRTSEPQPFALIGADVVHIAAV